MSVYFITCRRNRAVKIGWAFEPRLRLAALQAGNPYELVIEAILDGERETEFDLHQRFSAHRIRAEWFRLCPEIEAAIEANRIGLLPKMTWREKVRASRTRAEARERPLNLDLPVRRDRAA